MLPTRLVVVEGETELAFCQYVKQLFLHRRPGFLVKLKTARGGGYAEILRVAKRELGQAAFDEVVLVFDGDFGVESHRTRLGRADCTVIQARPCIEAELLRLLGGKVPSDSRKAKREFERHPRGLSARDKLDPGRYRSIFSFSMLSGARETVHWLDKLIEALSAWPSS